MPAFTDYTFPSCNGKTQIHVRRCTPDGEVRGVVQLAHGIAEHVERYDGFAAFLAENGYVVVANDHLGHGQSIGSEEELGCLMEEGGWKRLVIDMHTLCEKTAAEFPGLPYFLFGHSMGSFLARTYLIAYPEGLTAAVICGTGQQSGALVRAGRAMGRLEIRRHGADYKSELLNRMAFGAYNKGIEPQRTPCDWLTRDNAVVDAYIADPHAGFEGRLAFVGIGNDYRVATLLDQGPDAAVFTGRHGLEVRLIFLTVEFAVWIEFGEHGFHASGQSFSPVNGIDILSLQGRDGGSQDLHILLCVEVQVLHFLFVAIVRRLCLSLRGAGKAECQACDEANEAQHLFLHVLNIKKFGQISRFFFEYPKNDCVFCFFSGNLWEKWAKCLIFAAINSIYIVRCVPF